MQQLLLVTVGFPLPRAGSLQLKSAHVTARSQKVFPIGHVIATEISRSRPAGPLEKVGLHTAEAAKGEDKSQKARGSSSALILPVLVGALRTNV